MIITWVEINFVSRVCRFFSRKKKALKILGKAERSDEMR